MSDASLHALLYACVAAVVLGVILEGHEHWEDFRKKGWRPIVPKIGFALLVLGLAGELLLQPLIDAAEERFRMDAKERIARLGKDEASARERTSRAEIELARIREKTESQEGINRLLEHGMVRMLLRPPILHDRFLEALQGKPKGTVEILYQPEDTRAYWIADTISDLLNRAEWKVRGVRPARPSDDPALSAMPSIIAAGGHRFGLSLIANFIGGPTFDTETPYGALANALLRAGSDESGGSSPIILNTRPPDPILPDNEFRIVVGPGPYIL